MTNYRKIELPETPELRDLDQAAPMLDWLKIDSLVVDDTYQRSLNASNWKAIRKIAAEFRWSRFTPLLCAPVEGGRFAIIDGQHRAHAAAMIGIERVPAMIVHMSLPEQASAFSWVNGNVTKITGFHIFKAALAAKDQWAIDCDEVVRRAGCRLMPCNKSAQAKKAGEVYSIALVREYVEAGMPEVVEKCLFAIQVNDETQDPAPYHNIILRPFMAAVASSQLFLRADLVAFLRDHDLVAVQDRVADLRKQDAFRSKSTAALMKDSITALLRQFVEAKRAA